MQTASIHVSVEDISDTKVGGNLMHERLMRARYDKIVSGVCGGLAAYFQIDPIIVRVVMLLVMMTGVGFILYPVLWVLMPVEPQHPPQQLGGSGWVPPIQYDPRVQAQQPEPMRQRCATCKDYASAAGTRSAARTS